jgi:glycosyltransferase involved in cell wall biosynthesis
MGRRGRERRSDWKANDWKANAGDCSTAASAPSRHVGSREWTQCRCRLNTDPLAPLKFHGERDILLARRRGQGQSYILAPMSTLEYEVVIPAWNAEMYLAETLQSLRGQTVPPRRITVVDDGRTDGTCTVAEAYGAIVVTSPHVGVVGVRNQGLAKVEAPFVAFVDSDDVWLPGFAERQAEIWRSAEPSLAAVGSLVEAFGEGDLQAWQGPLARGGFRELGAEEVWDRNPLTASTILFRAEALRAIHGWREGYTPTDDYDTSLRLVSAGYRVGLVQEVLARYRVRNGSWSSRAKASLESEEKALRDFWSSSFRQETLPALLYAPRIRALWWRTLARAAQYGQDLREVPAPSDNLHPTLIMHIAHAVLRLPGAASVTAAMWRELRRRRPRCRPR